VTEGFLPADMKAFTTSGSTGRRTTVYYDEEAWITGKFLLKLRARLACGVRPWDRIALFQEGAPRNNRLRQHLLRQRTFPIDRGCEEILPEVEDYAPTVFYGFPSYFVRLNEVAGSKLRPAVIFTSGEMLDLSTRKAIETAFGAPAFDIYGCTELKEIAWQCRKRMGYHINCDRVLVEVKGNADGASEPEGELLVTSLYNFGMPLIRYAVGDKGRLLNGTCECGLSLPVMAPSIGRSVDYFALADGKLVAPYTMTCAIEKIEGIHQYQIVQESLGHVVVNVVPGEHFDSASRQAICMALAPILKGAAVDVRTVERIACDPTGKFRIVLSRVMGEYGNRG
jgi:phenylacetate-CoA ligase